MYPFAISTSTFQPNLRGPLDCLASMLGMACRRNRRWHLDSSPGKCIICSVSASTSAGVNSHNISNTTILLNHLSPLKDAFHLSKTLLISLRNLSPGLATVDVLSVTVPQGAQHHSKQSVNFFQTREIIVLGMDICSLT